MPHPGDQHRDTPASVNPFVKPEQHISEYTAQEIATLQSRLDKQLGPEYISTRTGNGGGKVHYLAAEKVINLANEIFGFNGWSTGIQNVQIDFVDENKENGKINLGLSTIVRVTLRNGTYHEDIGYGHIENCRGKAAAFEKAKKEAVTDALKRALRNFGNVLGNCLYDKDYLQRVTKIKVAPSRWDAANLHRHHDFAPIKPQSIDETEARQQKQATNPAMLRAQSLQSAASFGSADFEDDFGGNLFDETDFNHADGEFLDDTSLSNIESPAQRAINGPQQGGQRQGSVSRTTSMLQMRPPNIQAPQPPANFQAPPRPPGIQRPANNVNGVSPQKHHMPPQRPPQQLQVPGPHTNGNSPTATNQELVDGNGLPLPREPPPGVPDGFMSGRSVALLNEPPENRPPSSSMAFNPNAETPSIRRTAGVNPGKSAPILRQNLHAAGNPLPAGPGNGGSRATTPVRPNFVDPSAEPNRRIGAPGGVNRNAYKPPAAVGIKRPPLSDMSNIQQTDGASDPKKPRVDATEPANGEVPAAPSAPAASN